MRHVTLTLISAVLVALAVPGAASAESAAKKRRKTPRLSVLATEYSYGLSKRAIRAGKVRIRLRNDGTVVHDLRLRKASGKGPTFTVPLVGPGRSSTVVPRLKAGRYYLWCNVGSHEELGMSIVLKVKPKRR